MTNEILLAIIIWLLALSNAILYLRINNLHKMIKVLKQMVDNNFEFTTSLARETLKNLETVHNVLEEITDIFRN